MPYYVYVLKSLKAGRYYIGQSEDVTERLRRHNPACRSEDVCILTDEESKYCREIIA